MLLLTRTFALAAVNFLLTPGGMPPARLQVPLAGPHLLPDLEAALVYLKCGDSSFSIHRSPIPTIARECDHSDGRDYCQEAGTMIDFAIEQYYRPFAKRYVFAHAHDWSWHYQPDFWTAFDHVYGKEYWKTHRFGAIYSHYWHVIPWPPDEEVWAIALYHEIFAGTSMPPEPIRNTSRMCCSTFFVDSELIRNRPVDEYLLIRRRIRNWTLHHQDWKPSPGYFCGRVFEYSWQLLFGQTPSVERCRECVGTGR
jgi:hypothetical protein